MRKEYYCIKVRFDKSDPHQVKAWEFLQSKERIKGTYGSIIADLIESYHKAGDGITSDTNELKEVVAGEVRKALYEFFEKADYPKPKDNLQYEKADSESVISDEMLDFAFSIVGE